MRIFRDSTLESVIIISTMSLLCMCGIVASVTFMSLASVVFLIMLPLIMIYPFIIFTIVMISGILYTIKYTWMTIHPRRWPYKMKLFLKTLVTVMFE